MIKNQNQLDISNKSYTNKDFPEIYAELLTYAEKLSYRFSPVSANETDPFIVLLKLLAFVADKINYNIDKNILERFMLSCTQESSMRELADMVGYYMHYYQAATTDVIFKYDYVDCPLPESERLIIPKYSIISTDKDLQYVTLNDISIDRNTKYSLSVQAIQGKLKTLSVLGSTSIQLENLDSNNRLYLPERQIAENGMLITSAIKDDIWTRVDNLNEQDYLSAIFYFGYDSAKQLPYIQFPEWISRIIGDGLSIKYVVTDGYAGNIGPKSFTKVIRANKNQTDSDSIDDSLIIPINSSAATDGRDPESIEESYLGFKKLVGTLDTLVTCRDYAAKICELVDSKNFPLVSNAIVSDRRTDINNSTQIHTLGDFGKYYKTSIKTEAEEPVMSAADLCIYGFKPLINQGYMNANIAGGYNDSYNVIGNTSSQINKIQRSLEASKALSHDYKNLQQNDIICIEILLQITAVISTYTKVSNLEALEIKQVVLDTLLEKYNLHNITPGVEIPFDDIYDTILFADPRIKSVSLTEPDQTPNIRLYGGDVNESTLDDIFELIIIKNIASGRISAFDFDTRFNYEYMFKNSQIMDDVAYITTYANLELEKKGARYVKKLAPNEAIQFIAPRCNTFVTYPYGCTYYLELNDDNKYIKSGAEYWLQSGERLIIAYANSNKEWVADVYEGSNDATAENLVIISPNFDMYDANYRYNDNSESPDKKFKANTIGNPNVPYFIFEGMDMNKEYPFFTFLAKQELQCRKPVQESLKSPTSCYWITKNLNNSIAWSGIDSTANKTDKTEYEYILREDEYFYYTDDSQSVLVEFGSGTKLKLTTSSSYDRESWSISDSISADTIGDNGLDVLVDKFKRIDFTENVSRYCVLTIYVNDIKTLTTGDTIILTDKSASSVDSSINSLRISDNSFNRLLEYDYNSSVSTVDINDFNIKYTYDVDSATGDEAEHTLSARDSLPAAYKWQVRGLLDLNCGPNYEQILEAKHKIGITLKADVTDLKDGELPTPSIFIEPSVGYNKAFRCSIDLNMNGGENVPIGYIDLSSSDLSLQYPSIIYYDIDHKTAEFTHSPVDNFYKLTIKNISQNAAAPSVIDENNTSDDSEIPITDDDSKTILFHLPLDTRFSVACTLLLPSSYDPDQNGLKLFINTSSNNITVRNISQTSTSAASSHVGLIPGVNNLIFSKDVTSIEQLEGYDESMTEEDEAIAAFYLSVEPPQQSPEKAPDLNIDLSVPFVLKGINPSLGANKYFTTIDDLLTSMHTLETNNTIPGLMQALIFEQPEADKAIEVTPNYPLTSAQGFYDVNNIANKWVVPKLDISKFDISISKTSIKR